MPEEKHRFELQSVWTGGPDGGGTLTGASGSLSYGRPPQLGGAPGRTNPEEMLLAAVLSCYSITLAILAERRRVPIARIEVQGEGDVVRQLGGTLKYTAIRVKPRIVLAGGGEEERAAAESIAHKADQYCLISNAVRAGVELTVEPEVVIP